jgi:hypothetical protein
MRPQPNRHGACVLRVEGVRGVVWKIKFSDANGRQVKETLGREADGWTEAKARAELEARLVDVRREGLTKAPGKITFAVVADEWLATYPAKRALKRSTTDGYRSIVDTHLKPNLGHVRVADLDVGHLERYIAEMLRGGAAARTCNRHLNVVHGILKMARRQRLVRENVAELVERPPEPRLRWRILTPAEIARAETAFVTLAADADDENEQRWIEQARVVFLVIYATGLRRGEVLGLRWRNVTLADPAGPTLRVVETVVRGRADTPKSAASERTMSVCSVTRTRDLCSTTNATRTPFGQRSRRQRSRTRYGLSTTDGIRRLRTRPQREAPPPPSRPGQGTRTSPRRSGTSTSRA